jgi:predicted  nucleic acid-binding Zn-ribbon protein
MLERENTILNARLKEDDNKLLLLNEEKYKLQEETKALQEKLQNLFMSNGNEIKQFQNRVNELEAELEDNRLEATKLHSVR